MNLRLIVAIVAFAVVVALAAAAGGGPDAVVEPTDSTEPATSTDAAAPLLASDGESPQSDQPVSEPPIKLVHVLNPGEREYLSPNLIGVQNIAMTFLPLRLTFINIVDAFREIVNGVRYEIVLNAVDAKLLAAGGGTAKEGGEATPADVICRLVILEQPWLTTQWGDKVRVLQHSNCTGDGDPTEDNLADDPAARANVLNRKYQRNAFFNGGSRNELSADEMRRLNAQIVPSRSATPEATTPASTTTTTAAPSSSTERVAPSTTEPDDGAYTTAASQDENAGSDDGDDAGSTKVPELSDSEKRWLDDIFSVGALGFEQTHRGATQSNEATPPAENAAQTASDESNYVQQQNQQQQQNQHQQGQVEREQEQAKSAAAEEEAPQPQPEQLDDAALARAKRDVLVGAPVEDDTDDAEKQLKNSLDQLAAGEGPTYKIGHIYSSRTQVVSGTLTKIDADLIGPDGSSERCNVEIWSQLWRPEDAHEVTIKCPSKETVKRRHSRSVEHAEKKTHKKHDHHNLEKTEHLFNKFQAKYNRRYHTSGERQMRLRIFKQNLKIISDLNRYEMGSAKYGLTEFADMTSSEYKERTGLWQRAPDALGKNAAAIVPDVPLPKEFDWRQKGAVSGVKNQGACGSCWAFSVTGNIEGLHAVKTGQLEEYSEQELLDCDTEDNACNGGLPDNAYDAILKIGGLELESEYPYHGRKEQCRFNKDKVHVRVKSAVDLPKNETAMAQWLITNGPISIGINANAMQFYRGGVSHPWHALCSAKKLDHGVLVVGYGVSDYPTLKKTLPYWIIKNSWGPKWGEQGYYRVYRGDNTCGMSEMASSAVLAD